jgi:putative endonuclease
MIYFIYILECQNKCYYTGFTTDIKRRYREHVAGTNKCKYTRSFPPQKLCACWKMDGARSDALKIERYIKNRSRAQKETLIAHPETLQQIHENLFLIESHLF